MRLIRSEQTRHLALGDVSTVECDAKQILPANQINIRPANIFWVFTVLDYTKAQLLIRHFIKFSRSITP